MSTADEKMRAFRAMLARMSERDLVTRLKAASLMAAVDEEFKRRLKPELIEEGNAHLEQLGGISSTQELLSILRSELQERREAKSQGAS